MEAKPEDFFEYYPDRDSPSIQTELAQQYEFHELKHGPKDEKLKGDDYFKTQRTYQRIGKAYDRIFLYGIPGAGKSRCYACLGEYLKYNDPFTTKSYFVTGTAQTQDFKDQLVYGITNSDYLTERIKNYDPKSKGFTTIIGNSVKENWNVHSYGTLATEFFTLIQGLEVEDANQKIRENYSGFSYFFDEIQFAKINPTKTKENRKRHQIYEMIWRISHVAERTRITLGTGTFITNSITEFGYAANLILPADSQIPVDYEFSEKIAGNCGVPISYGGPEIDWQIINKFRKGETPEEVSDYYLEQLKDYLQGRMIYISAADTGVRFSYRPVQQPLASKEDQAEIAKQISNYEKLKAVNPATEKVRFLEFAQRNGKLAIQGRTYQEYHSRVRTADDKRSFKLEEEKYILTFVFPESPNVEKNWGVKAGNYWLTTKGGIYDFNENAETDGPSLREYMTSRLGELSAKMEFARHGAANHMGKGYCMFEAVQGGGIYVHGLALQLVQRVFLKDKWYSGGFERYTSGTKRVNFFKVKSLSQYLTKAPRYAIIAGDVPAQEVQDILTVFKHIDNLHGEYIKEILISKVGQTGLNLHSVSRIYNFFTSHSPAELLQGLSRANRATSHVEYLKWWNENFPDIPFFIEVNLMACIFPKGYTPRDTTDSGIYLRTHKKDINIACMNRVMKRTAMTGYILEERNTHPSMQDNSSECDYMKCKLDFLSEEPDISKMRYENYLLMYAKQAVADRVEDLKRELDLNGNISIAKYVARVSGGKEPARSIAYLAVIHLKEMESQTDRFGLSSEIVEHSGRLYSIRKNTRISTGYFSSFYSRNLITIETLSLEKILESKYAEESRTMYDQMIEETSKAEISSMFGVLSPGVKAIILERAVDEVIANPELVNDRKNFFEVVSFGETEPGNLISMLEPLAKLRGGGYSDLAEEGQPIFVHNAYVFEESKSKTAMAARYTRFLGRLRVRRQSEEEWRDCSITENQVYSEVFSTNFERIADVIDKKRDMRIYGLITNYPMTEIRIVDRTAETEISKGSEIASGQTAHQIPQKSKLLMYMWVVGMRPDMNEVESSFPGMSVFQKRKVLHILKHGEHSYKQVSFPEGLVYHFNPGKNKEVNKAPAEMVHFFHYYLAQPQSMVSKTFLAKQLAVFLNANDMIVSPSLNKYQITEAVQNWTSDF